MPAIDLNADLGEGAGRDAELMALVTSANIACGGHAGDEAEMRRTVEMALGHGVAIGAHPGFADREHFGRRELDLGPGGVGDLVARQLRALRAIAAEAGARLAHVKPHGALYNLAARSEAVAGEIARAVAEEDPDLILVGLAGGRLTAAGRALGLRVAAEAFADRAYLADGSLAPRGRPGAVLERPEEAAEQAVRLAREGRVRTADGGELELAPDTICLHGDGPRAAAVARRVRAGLEAAGIDLRPLR
jgi:5-oxoprolinase (ATP-hydrolysing) subunit A